MPKTEINPSQLKDTLTHSDFSSSNVDGTSSTPSLRTLGNGAQQAAAGNHTHPGIGGTKQNITDGATITLAWVHGSLNVVTLGGNRTLAISGSPVAGESCKLKIIQDGTGNRTLTWPTSGVTINWPLGEDPILTTTASRADIIELTCSDDTVGALVFDATYMMFNIY